MDLLCGKRGSDSYTTATRTKIDMGTMQFVCPKGLTPCSTNIDLGGSTTCVKVISDCPITDLVLLDQDTTSYKLTDPKYTVRLGFSVQNPIYLAFTKTTNDRSNAPFQSLQWELGQICAFTDQSAVIPKDSAKPIYYPLEAATNLEPC